MSEISQVCPGCGSKINIANGFFCGTKYWNNGWHRSADCYRNQIDSLQAEVVAQISLVKEMGVFCRWVQREGAGEPFSFNQRGQKYQELKKIMESTRFKKIMAV